MTQQELIKNAIETAANMTLPEWTKSHNIVFGIRYDNKVVTVGEELECSISNAERDDERDFPEYDPDADRLDGTCAYLLADMYTDFDDEDDMDQLAEDLCTYIYGKKEAAWDHCSLVIGWDSGDYAEDMGEVVIAGCEVVKVFW